jgi:exodeoxyribonuclease VII large subunit
MPKSTKTHWDFGELFPKETTRKVLSVSELTIQIKRLLEKQVGQIWVTGEITNLRAQSSGHMYFTLKDASTQLSCVLFRSEAVGQRNLLQDGQKVTLQGEVTVYEPRGQYQLRVTAVELQGIGALQVAFERLKQKLNAEGLFAQERKRVLPRFPQRIGLVTSPTGAAIRDVLHVIARRNPGLEIIFAPCSVQGQGAGFEIATAIRQLNVWNTRQDKARQIDLILVTRGGGSLEDLWAFNEEIVARAIFESRLPVVSAVGHEIDFTISDFVADLRAATPSAAAEIITEGAFASRQFVFEATQRLRVLARRRFEAVQEEWAGVAYRLAMLHPRRQVNDKLQRLDDLQTGLIRCVKRKWRNDAARFETALEAFARLRPAQMLAEQKGRLAEQQRRLLERVRFRLQALQARETNVEARLRLLSPTNVLQRGYSITTDEATGRIIRDAKKVKAAQRIRTRLKLGEVSSTVIKEEYPTP